MQRLLCGAAGWRAVLAGAVHPKLDRAFAGSGTLKQVLLDVVDVDLHPSSLAVDTWQTKASEPA